MSNILDYIAWRGDLPFSAVPVNEVDGLILAQLSMLRWENGLGDGQSARLCELSELLDCQPVSAGFTPENDLKRLNYATCIRRLQRDTWKKASALMTQDLLS